MIGTDDIRIFSSTNSDSVSAMVGADENRSLAIGRGSITSFKFSALENGFRIRGLRRIFSSQPAAAALPTQAEIDAMDDIVTSGDGEPWDLV